MAARLSALRAGRFLSPRRFLVLISVRGWVDPRAIARLEELGKLKKKPTSYGTRKGDLLYNRSSNTQDFPKMLCYSKLSLGSILSQMNPIYFPYYISLTSILIQSLRLRLDISSDIFRSCFHTKTLYKFFCSFMHATVPTNLILIDSIILIIFWEKLDVGQIRYTVVCSVY
jgi:hypothetical protein